MTAARRIATVRSRRRVLRPERFDAAFDTFIFPLLGIVFVPMATLLYAILHTPGIGLSGWEWFWVVTVGFFDLAQSAGAAMRREALAPQAYRRGSMT